MLACRYFLIVFPCQQCKFVYVVLLFVRYFLIQFPWSICIPIVQFVHASIISVHVLLLMHNAMRRRRMISNGHHSPLLLIRDLRDDLFLWFDQLYDGVNASFSFFYFCKKIYSKIDVSNFSLIRH